MDTVMESRSDHELNKNTYEVTSSCAEIAEKRRIFTQETNQDGLPLYSSIGSILLLGGKEGAAT
jgi:hypothetical protein